MRYARTLELPASRGRILDRNGLMLATSVPAPSIWAIPKDVERDAGQARAARRSCSSMTAAPSSTSKLDDETRTSSGSSARSTNRSAQAGRARSDIKGIHQRKEYKRQYPEGEAAAHVVGFTNVEDHGQEGIELAFDKELAGRDGSRRVIKDRLGRVVEDVGEQVPPVDGQDIAAVDRLQGAVLRLPAAARRGRSRNKAKAGSVVVLDAQTGEVLALANYPSYAPGRAPEPHRRAAAQPRADRHLRARLDDEAVRRRAGRSRPAASRRRR